MVLVAALSLTNCMDHSLSWAIYKDKPIVTTCIASINGTMFRAVELHGNIVWGPLQAINNKVKTQGHQVYSSYNLPWYYYLDKGTSHNAILYSDVNQVTLR